VAPPHASPTPPPPVLVGRTDELARIDLLLAHAREGLSGGLVLWGETGIGKTALLDYAIAAAPDMTSLRTRGSESALAFPHAGLRLLLEPLLEGVPELPEPQRAALSAAIGLATGEAADEFLVGLATLTLLSNGAGDGALLCVVDDVQWLDDASTRALAFVGARLDAEGVALLGASDAAHAGRLGDLARLQVGPLDDDSARLLLEQGLPPPLGPEVVRTLVADLGGNPLALLEVPRELSAGQIGGTAALPDPLPLGARLEASLLHRVEGLPADVRELLLVAAAEPGAAWELMRSAAELLGLSADTLAALRQTGLLEASEVVHFRHSFTRAAVYAAASSAQLQRAHAALAEVTDRVLAPDRRAWHLGAAATAPDAGVADELEQAAERTVELRGYAAAAALLGRSADLSVGDDVTAERRLAAARAELAAGRPNRAALLLERAAPDLVGELPRAEALRLRGQLALALGENGHTAGLLSRAAKALEPLDARRARDAHLEAVTVALYAGRLASRSALLEATKAGRGAPPPEAGPERPADVLLDGLTSLVLDGHAAAAPALAEALELLRDGGDLQWVGLAGHVASELWDEDAIHALSSRRVRLARASGALTVLPNALGQHGGYELLVGRLDAAAACFEEAHAIMASTGNPGIVGRADVSLAALAAWRGEADRARSLAQASARDATARGIGVLADLSFQVLAVLENALGGYDAALTAAREAIEGNAFWVATRTLPELVEAAARSGDRDAAEEAVSRLAKTVLPRSTEWGLGMLSRSRALIAGDDDAAALYEDAIDHLRRSRTVPELGRARLLFGEWLRRKGERRRAREQLRLAYELFDSMGAGAFASRAGSELGATGARVRPRSSVAPDVLTPHEARIAKLARDGASNAEIAAQLFISPRTVEYHLHKIFRKLGIGSRTQLPRTLGREREHD
jgi:DNA-binding CsgD family transcriptional regulator/tetratricopeptide (TPR) repeat protein